MMELENKNSEDIEQKKLELLEEEGGAYRALPGILGLIQRGLMCLIPLTGILFVFDVHSYFGWSIYTEQYIGLFLTYVLVGSFLSIPATKRAPRNRLPWYDALFALGGFPAGMYIAVKYPELAMNLSQVTPASTICGLIAMVLILEATRRYVGGALVICVIIFVVYGRYADMVPGAFKGYSMPWDALINYLYLDPNSLLDQISLAGGIALAFLFFGQVLSTFGGGTQLMNFAVLGFGRYRGGSAKAAVVGSSLIGMISGGAITNVMIAGTVTIPMMIKTGYKPVLAGAIEAVASSGGQITPPVMGVAAFIIAEYLQVPYAEVALAALLPALLFYLACFVQVDLEAGKLQIGSVPPSAMSNALSVLRSSWTIFPCLAVLIYTLIIAGMDGSSAGLISGFASIPFLLMSKAGRGQFWRRILEVFEGSGRMAVNMGLLIAASGFIVGVTNVTGLGFNLTYALTTVGKESSFLLLMLAAGVSIILGTGLPTVPAYVLVATLVAPALVEMGIVPMAAHLFIFYFAIVSNWTPPVAPACFAASVIARANSDKIGWVAMRIGILAYIVPFLFVYSPALILKDGLLMILISIAFAAFGTFMLGVFLVGYLFQDVPWSRRILFLIAGAGLMFPLGMGKLSLIINGIGLVATIPLLIWEWFLRRSAKLASDNEPLLGSPVTSELVD
ncbi:MAG: TRAP transporter fused permease subunit [Thermincola sp.]|jgi:TRAP transporter 4TM/12TM fusion protein|nr:TRAP transporter fused permease subunit [Thermincola sp.]MDT3702894.1 TRAP transporter fused permease subunit [Thermincola sp.]